MARGPVHPNRGAGVATVNSSWGFWKERMAKDGHADTATVMKISG
jgi:hypothetical protein